MKEKSTEELLARIAELESRLEESEQLIDAIKAGEVDAFAVNAEVYTLQSGDYAYRVLIEQFGEGALNLTEDGLVVYTNSAFAELIEHPYEKVVGTNFIDCVDSGSKEIFNVLLAQALHGKSKGEINLWVDHKTIPIYISLTSLQPKLPTIGVIITDLTDKKNNEEVILQYQKDLETKNNELVQNNAELASFTYIASHDLQEPLRKIQTFSNRILEKEYEHLPVNIRDYFDRIINASVRMQNLIAALLNYSRTNAADELFAPTEMNVLLIEVKNSLVEQIDETGTTIEIPPLPTLNIIPYQFAQLFENLIGNAIKYRKPNEPPVIKISVDVVPGSEIQVDETHLQARYWKLKVKDNGIGFEQQYSEKIFELFQRLHGRSEYDGTGIGLAICKKIMQNHQGFIKAESEVGEGSSISIYVPIYPHKDIKKVQAKATSTN